MPTNRDKEAWKEQLVKNAEQKILTLTSSEKFKKYLMITAKFPSYSWHNQSLIWAQNDEATQVAGFKQWQRDFNRSVNKGEKALRIAAPIIKKLTPDEQKRLKTRDETGVVGYRYIPVFDVSQTSGDPVPNVGDFVKENLADHKNVAKLYAECKSYLNSQTNLHVIEQNLSELKGAKGLFNPMTDEIVIGADEPDSALKLKTLFHEYAHSQLHGLTSAFKDRPREYKEAQAESVAYVAMQNLGIDTGNYSLGYVATWAKDPTVIHSALSEIQQVSNKTIDLSNKMVEQLELNKERNLVPVKEKNKDKQIQKSIKPPKSLGLTNTIVNQRLGRRALGKGLER